MRAFVVVLLLAGVACTRLPEPESAGAKVFAAQCGTCHRVYAPASMTWPMWEYQLGRMRLLFAQLRRPWLTPEDEKLVVDYLRRHAGGV